MNNDPLLILPEPTVVTLEEGHFQKRKYAPIWKECLKIPGRHIIIKMTVPTDASFRTIRKAVWKIKNEDLKNRSNWRLICERVGDRMHFWIIPSDITTRI